MTVRSEESTGPAQGQGSARSKGDSQEHGLLGGLFPLRDRQILLRSEQGVRSLRISRKRQLAAFGTLAGLVVWAVAATTGMVVNHTQIAEQRVVIRDMELGYAELVSDMSNRRGSLEAVNQRLARHEVTAESLRSRNDAVQAELASLADDLAGSEAARADLIASRAALEAELLATQRQVEALAVERRATEAELAGLMEELRDRESAVRALRDERTALQRELAQRDQALDAADQFAEALEAQISELGSAVQNAYGAVDTLMRERDGLRETVGLQSRDLADAADREGELRTQLRAAWYNLATISMERDDLLTEQGHLLAARERADRAAALADREVRHLAGLLTASYHNAAVLAAERDRLLDDSGGLVAEVERLDRELRHLRGSQEQILAEIRGRADEHISDVRDGLAFTGLNVDDLLSRLRGEAGRDTGGPMIPLIPDQLHQDPDWAEALDVVSLVGRAAELRDVVNRLPVATPVRGNYRVSSGFRTRRDPFTGRTSRHLGIDFAGPRRSNIYASAPGRVIHAGRQGAFGNLVEIEHGLGIVTRYAHLHAIDVRIGQEVDRGQRIGLLGCTGRCTGPHLHYEVLVNGEHRDPANFLRAGRHVFQIAQQAERH